MVQGTLASSEWTWAGASKEAFPPASRGCVAGGHARLSLNPSCIILATTRPHARRDEEVHARARPSA
jgi:hypothetical protein